MDKVDIRIKDPCRGITCFATFLLQNPAELPAWYKRCAQAFHVAGVDLAVDQREMPALQLAGEGYKGDF